MYRLTRTLELAHDNGVVALVKSVTALTLAILKTVLWTKK